MIELYTCTPASPIALLLVGWGIWSTGDPETGDVVLSECNNTKSGIWSSSCASFPTLLTASGTSQQGVNIVLMEILYSLTHLFDLINKLLLLHLKLNGRKVLS